MKSAMFRARSSLEINMSPQAWTYVVVLAASIWVAVDASKLDAKRGVLGGGLLDMGPVGWFFSCLMFWIVTFPCYLITRPKLVRRAKVLATEQQLGVQAGYTAQGTHPAAPLVAPPGWYPNPERPGSRWWDGQNWAADDTVRHRHSA